MLNVTTSFAGFDELYVMFAKLQAALTSPYILDEAAASLLARTRQRFLAQTDPDGIPWTPSIAALLRAKRGRGGGTLFDTGRLFHSIQLYATGENSREIGSDVPYGVHHQFGTDHMVKREFLGISEDDTDVMVAIVSKRILEVLNS